MSKSPIKRRARALYKVWDHRREILKKEGNAADRKPTTNQRIKFRYTTEERYAIANELAGNSQSTATSLSESLDEIEILVRLTLQAEAYREQHPIADDLQAQFRALEKPTEQILAALDDPELDHLKEFVPNLRAELTFLFSMVRADQRKGRGKPRDPAVALRRSLTAMLANVWVRHQEKWPTRYFSDEKGRDWGPFYRFLDTCLKPANIQVSDYVIRKGLGL